MEAVDLSAASGAAGGAAMTMLAGTHLWRPSATALVLVLVIALLAPLTIAPERAQAGPCDWAGVSTVCDGADAAGDAAADAIGGAADLARDALDRLDGLVDGAKDAYKGAVKGVKAAAEWASENAGPILKAAAAAGLALGTWVACSKVGKIAVAATAGTAGAAGSGGLGGPAAAAAGAAGAAAVCTLLKKGGKVVLKIGKKAVKGGGKLAGVAKLAAGAIGLAAIVYGVDHAAAWVLQNLLDFDAESAPQLDAPWLTDLRKMLNGTAAVLLLLATILGMTIAGALGRVSDVGRIFTSMVTVALIIGVVGSILLAGLRMSDAVTTETLNSSWGQKSLGNWKDLGDSYAGATPTDDADAGAAQPDAGAAAPDTGESGTPPADDEKGPWPIRLLIAFFTALFGAIVKLEMLVRDGLLYLLLAFGGLLLAGYPLPATRGLAQRFGMTLLGVVVAKPVIVVTLLMGGAMMQSAAAGGEDGGVVIPLLQGAGLMALAAFMGSAILGWFGMHGAAAMTGLGNRMAGGGMRGMTRAGSSGKGAGGAGGDTSGGPDGDGDGGPGGGDGGSDRPDPTRDLARGVGDRVNTGTGAAGLAGAAAFGAGAGAASSRLRAAQAREQHAPASDGSGPPAGPASTGGQHGAADAPTQPMPVASSAGARPATSDTRPATGQGGPGAQNPAGVGQGRNDSGDDGSDGSAARLATNASAAAAGAGAGAGSAATTGTSGAGARGAAAPPSAGVSGPAAVPGSGGAVPIVPPAPPAAAEGRTSTPGSPTSTPAVEPPRPAPVDENATAYAAFGAPGPHDAAAAFSDHDATIREALDARPEVRS